MDGARALARTRWNVRAHCQPKFCTAIEIIWTLQRFQIYDDGMLLMVNETTCQRVRTTRLNVCPSERAPQTNKMVAPPEPVPRFIRMAFHLTPVRFDANCPRPLTPLTFVGVESE